MKGPPKMMVSSSPGRAEKLLAPPFTKLMRGKGGSRSRGRAASLARSTSSPMFATRRRSSTGSSSADVHDEKGEPSSPKVTCIGQVRITKKKKKKKQSEEDHHQQQEQKKLARKGKHCSGSCQCFDEGALSCNPFSKAKKTKKRSSVLKWKWCIWSSPCSRSYQKQRKEEEDPKPVAGPPFAADWSREVKEREFWTRRFQGEAEKVEEREEPPREEEEEMQGFVPPATPPKNALLLMRCRSAPQKSSPLTARFWVPGTEAGDADEGTGVQPTTSPMESNPIVSDSAAATESKVVRSSSSDRQEEGSGDVSSREEEEEEAGGPTVGPSPSFSSRPLILTRCKSEPAREAAKLAAAPEAASHCFLNLNGSGKSKKWMSLAQEEPFPKRSEVK